MARQEKETARPRKRKKDAEREQSERFKETARKLGADETGAEFERAFGLIVPPKPRRRHSND